MNKEDKKILTEIVKIQQKETQKIINDLDKKIQELEEQKKYHIKQIKICETWLKIQEQEQELEKQKQEIIITEY